jgi:hypothetical protein
MTWNRPTPNLRFTDNFPCGETLATIPEMTLEHRFWSLDYYLAEITLDLGRDRQLSRCQSVAQAGRNMRVHVDPGRQAGFQSHRNV